MFLSRAKGTLEREKQVINGRLRRAVGEDRLRSTRSLTYKIVRKVLGSEPSIATPYGEARNGREHFP